MRACLFVEGTLPPKKNRKRKNTVAFLLGCLERPQKQRGSQLSKEKRTHDLEDPLREARDGHFF